MDPPSGAATPNSRQDIVRILAGLTESLLADNQITWLAGFTLAALVEGLDAEGVLLLFHEALQLVLSLGDIFCDADPLLAPGLLKFDDVAFDLGPTIVLRSGPCQQSGGLANVSDDRFTRSPRRV